MFRQIQDIAKQQLASTEADSLVVGYASATGMVFVCPIWETESMDEARALAAKMAIKWADDHGAGDVQVACVSRLESAPE